MKTAFSIVSIAAAVVFAGELQANDFLKVLDQVNKAVDTIQDAGVSGVQASTGFDNGAATGVATSFPVSTKIIYVSYTASGASTSVPIQSVWSYSKDGTYNKFYTLKDVMPKSGSAAAFKLSRADGKWPVGDYKVELVVAGKTLGSVVFNVAQEIQDSGSSGVWDGQTAPSVTNVVAATGFSSGAAVGATSSFPDGTKVIYVCYTAAGQSSGVKTQSVWYQIVSGASTKVATLNATLPDTGKAGEFHLSVKGGGAFPAGDYKVDILVNDAVSGSVSFKVEAPSNSGEWAPSASTSSSSSSTSATTSSASTSSSTSATTAPAGWEDTVKNKAKTETQSQLDTFFK